MLPVPIKIRAVREDSENPILACYSTDDPTALAKMFAARVIPTTTPTPKKEVTTMSLNPEFTTAPRPVKQHVSGIGAGSPGRLVEVLSHLGLCPSELQASLKTLAAHGKPLAQYYQVSVDQLDLALMNVEASVDQRFAFKYSLKRAGLLK
jgi:hypothetical protein